MDKSELCRVCADFSDNTNPLFEGCMRKLLPKIRDLTGLQLKKLKELPQRICKSCEQQILQAHKFRNCCIRAQKRLGKHCDRNDETAAKSKKKNTTNECPQIKEETVPPIEEVLCNETNSFKLEEHHEGEEEMLLKQEPTNVDDNSNHSFNFLTDDSIDEDVLAIEPEISLHTSSPHKSELKAPPPQHKEKKTKSSEKKTKKSLSGGGVEKNFICDQCGQHFTVKYHFQMHMLRHTGIRPFPCKLCSRGYYASSDLKRHMFTHTGEKPYPCKYCDRCFNDGSHRLRHTRAEHTGERPFTCDHCPKSFISSNNYRTHLVTHSGVRAFVCKLCNVSYKRHSHLARHNRSVMHKQNLETKQTTNNQTTECTVDN